MRFSGRKEPLALLLCGNACVLWLLKDRLHRDCRIHSAVLKRVRLFSPRKCTRAQDSGPNGRVTGTAGVSPTLSNLKQLLVRDRLITTSCVYAIDFILDRDS